MSSEIEALVTEFDDEAPQGPSPSARDEISGANMTFDIEAEIAKRRNAIRRATSRTDPVHLKAGIEAYKRDLPRLLSEHPECQIVAYDGEKRVAVARNSQELAAMLKREGIVDRGRLFIKQIAPLDDEGEHFQSNPR